MPRRRAILAVIGLAILTGLSLITGCRGDKAPARHARTPIAAHDDRPQPQTSPSLDSTYDGWWQNHTGLLDIDLSGETTFSWGAGFCKGDPPMCEGNEAISFRQVDSNLSGTITRVWYTQDDKTLVPSPSGFPQPASPRAGSVFGTLSRVNADVLRRTESGVVVTYLCKVEPNTASPNASPGPDSPLFVPSPTLSPYWRSQCNF